MRRPYTQLYVHLVWATWDRLPLILPTIEPRLYAALAAKCEALNCHPLAIGGVENHVHLLAGIPATVTIADLVKGVKGSTSHLLNHVVLSGGGFQWQGAYGAFTVSKSGVKKVVEYIRCQKIHHATGQLIDDLEKCEEVIEANKFGI